MTSSGTRADGHVTGLLAPLTPVLAAVNDRIRRFLQSDDPEISRIMEILGAVNGKRLRPAMLILTADAFGGDGSCDEAVSLAACLEMIHIASLCHDDVLDDAAHRRGRPTLNAECGIHAAILAGDWVFRAVFDVLLKMRNINRQVIISRALSDICAGEIIQVERRNDFTISYNDYFDMIDRKTGVLFSVACRLGADIAGASDAGIRTAAEYGAGFGRAFQIVDDVLDIAGRESVSGKTLHRDLLNGEATLPFILYRDSLSGSERADVLRAAARAADPSVRERISAAIVDSGAVARALAIAADHVQMACAAVASHPPSPAARLLNDLARQLVDAAT